MVSIQIASYAFMMSLYTLVPSYLIPCVVWAAVFKRYSDVENLEQVDALIEREEKVKRFKKLFVQYFPFENYQTVKENLMIRLAAHHVQQRDAGEVREEDVADMTKTGAIWLREYTPDLHEAARIIYNSAALSEQCCVAVGININAFTDNIASEGSFARFEFQ